MMNSDEKTDQKYIAMLKVLEFIYEYDQEIGRPPTQRKTAEELNMASSQVQFFVTKLVERGYLRVVKGKRCARFVTDLGKNALAIDGLIPERLELVLVEE